MGAPVAKPGLPHVAEAGGGVDPLPLPDARVDSLPVRRRGCDVGAELARVMGGEALVPGCAGIPGDARAGDRVAVECIDCTSVNTRGTTEQMVRSVPGEVLALGMVALAGCGDLLSVAPALLNVRY